MEITGNNSNSGNASRLDRTGLEPNKSGLRRQHRGPGDHRARRDAKFLSGVRSFVVPRQVCLRERSFGCLSGFDHRCLGAAAVVQLSVRGE
jgi:hypothetical protein